MEISDLEPLVNAGARLLDEKQPGWYGKFTDAVWQTFNMRDGYHDVLGTVFGSFHQGMNVLFPYDTFSQQAEGIEDNGFDIGSLILEVYDEYDPWNDLEMLWREVIVDRQENGVPSE